MDYVSLQKVLALDAFSAVYTQRIPRNSVLCSDIHKDSLISPEWKHYV